MAAAEVQVKADRSAYLDSILMKTMKEAKEMTEDALIEDIKRQLIFPLEHEDIVARFEVLLKRGLLDRCEGNTIKYSTS